MDLVCHYLHTTAFHRAWLRVSVYVCGGLGVPELHVHLPKISQIMYNTCIYITYIVHVVHEHYIYMYVYTLYVYSI